MPTGEAVQPQATAALFEQGRDISDPDVLSAIATRHGLRSPDDGDRRRAVEDWHDGQARGVVGSPHFFLATEDFFCPTLEIMKDNGQLRITTDERASPPSSMPRYAPDRCRTPNLPPSGPRIAVATWAWWVLSAATGGPRLRSVTIVRAPLPQSEVGRLAAPARRRLATMGW